MTGGMDDIRRNAAALQERMQKAAMDAADEIAHLLESYAKTHAPFTDRTGNLRQSTKGTPERASQDVYRVVLSAGMDYGKFVELCNNGHYAYLWPALMENEARIQEIWSRRLRGAMRA